MTKQINKKIIGIDLGTTNSCVAYFENNTAHVIKNRSGERTTPSVVSFDKDGVVKVGSIAKRQLIVNPDRTVYSIKRIMGTDKKTKILGKEYTPEDISAYILMELKKQASDYLGYDVSDAVITVPAYFTEVQRQATKDAGQIAGLNVVRLVNEPTAAALSYKSIETKKESSTILVYDLGGGTFDVSILKVENGIFEVVSTNGDRNLGGDDFDLAILNWAIENINKEMENQEPIQNSPEKKQRIRLEAERVKKELSFTDVVNFDLPFLTSSFSFSKQISRTLFENLTKDLLEKTNEPVKTALKDAKLNASDISDILLVGGSTRMPCVKNFIKKTFSKEPIISIDPDESVALGASIQGGIVQGDNKDIVLIDVTPLSLGIEESGNLMSIIIPRNTTIPTQKEQIYTNSVDNQPEAFIRIFQGERKLTKDNELLGEFSVQLKPARRGELKIKVSFDLDVNGILKVTAFDEDLNKPNNINITRKNLSQEEIDAKIKQAEEFKEKDQQESKKIKLFNTLENIRYIIVSCKDNKNCEEKDKEKIIEIENSLNESGWFKKDDFDVSSLNEIEEKLNSFEREIFVIKAKIEDKSKTKENDNSKPEEKTEEKTEESNNNSENEK